MEYEPHRDYLVDIQRYDAVDADQFITNDASLAETEELRRVAFRLDALEHQSAEYWQNFISNREEIRRMEREETRTTNRGRKRKRASESMELTDMSSPASWSSSDKQRSQPCDQRPRIRDRLPTPGAIVLKKRDQVQVPSRNPGHTTGGMTDEADVNRGNPFIKEKLGHRLQEFREQHEKSVTGSPPKPGSYTIFVGKEKVCFESTRDAVMQSKILSGQIKSTGTLGTYVDISDIFEVTAKDFILVSEYLKHSEFAPRLIERENSMPRLADVSRAEQRVAAAESCARLFRTASHLQIAGLQYLCLNKLKALYPLTPLCILIVARIFVGSTGWGCEAETEFVDWLVDLISEYYWSLTKQHGELLVDVLDGSDEIRERVVQNISADPEMGRRGLDEE
ncbi:hypothetical protein LTR01_000194 [Friedmanniomyces endolithicus]|nr:hypothetical protein LTS09_012211 [Friedmanniomyces endolithicus]KAK0316446.1 hypothetical protein LTR01_000194 [Friedmanniomyces endolithicus]KAK0834622.1 hypothetical protein LTR73_000911 [Friedmanniomyces endolithicus]